MTKLVCRYLMEGDRCGYCRSVWWNCPFPELPRVCHYVMELPSLLEPVEVPEYANPNRIPRNGKQNL